MSDKERRKKELKSIRITARGRRLFELMNAGMSFIEADKIINGELPIKKEMEVSN